MSRPGRARPEHWFGSVSATVGLLLVWAAVAHVSGSGWVQALGALAAGVALVGMGGPYLAIRRLEVRVESSPEDATTGQGFQLVVVASSPCRLTPVRPGGASVRLRSGAPTGLELLPEHRGELLMVEVDLSSASPFGLLWWSKRVRLALPRTLVVSPMRAPSGRAGEEGSEPGQSAQERRLSEIGERRGSREYRVGDSPRRVDWRATAHTGSLMVRESDASFDRPVRVLAELPEEIESAEEVASRLLAAVCGYLDEGRPVIVETRERGVAATRVTSQRQAGRLLGRLGINPWGVLGRRAREQ